MKKEKARKARAHFSVASWWAATRNSRRLLPEGKYTEGEDFTGPEKWPDYTTLETLHEEYCRWPMAEPMTKLSFGAHFRSYTGCVREKIAVKRYNITQMHDLKGSRVMYDTGKFRIPE